MEDVIKKTIEAAEHEKARLQKKLRKMQYGS